MMSKISKSYERRCFKHFKKLRQHHNCFIRYEAFGNEISVFYYYNNDELFDVREDINILRQFLKKCKFDLYNWNIEPVIGMFNNAETNYSNILFKREFKFLTRLDVKRR